MRVFTPLLATVTAALLGFAGSLSMVAPAAAVTEEFRPGAESPTGGFASAWKVSSPSDHMAQPFTQTETGNLATVRIKLNNIETGADFTSMNIHEFDDATGPAAEPLAGGSSSAITLEEPDGSGQLWAKVSFADRPLLTKGSRYALVIDPVTKSGENASFVMNIDWENSDHDFKPWVRNGADGWQGYSTGYLVFTSQLVTRFVAPTEPALKRASACGVEARVSLPNDEGVIYSETRDGDVITVTAAAAEGYFLEAGATTEWQFTVTAETCPEPKDPSVTTPEDPQEPVDPAEPADPSEPTEQPSEPTASKPTTDAKTPSTPESLASTGGNPGMIGLAAVAAITLGAALVVLRRARSARA
ncbi:hypothetical protein JSO19_03595 [Leucobacter sp. UCMA 4100]|uniref:hypothetical protein n=1 Tax=Leucobacter sp. UCMA 4100 TaxID=2810534 RepID=UPI0022EB6748|nr:hypothetical protein [Leucobacter sp. UCMA 4100]MDA3146459.1 hypothetical protein [Leucobacter sp. UCMA 4100]